VALAVALAAITSIEFAVDRPPWPNVIGAIVTLVAVLFRRMFPPVAAIVGLLAQLVAESVALALDAEPYGVIAAQVAASVALVYSVARLSPAREVWIIAATLAGVVAARVAIDGDSDLAVVGVVLLIVWSVTVVVAIGFRYRSALEDAGVDADSGAGNPSDLPQQVHRTERWFVHRGVPTFIESSNDGSIYDVWTRALPLLVPAYLLLGFNTLELTDWTLEQNFAAAIVTVGVLVATWVVSNKLRGKPATAYPTDIDTPELALFVIGPTIPVLLSGQPGDAVENVMLAIVLLLLIYTWSAFGIGALLRWAARQSRQQITSLVSLVARALPLLLLFTTFLFINAEVWELAGTNQGIPYAMLILTFFLLGVTFAVSRIPPLVRNLNRFETWDEVSCAAEGSPADGLDPETDAPLAESTTQLSRAQRLNIGLVVLFGQALQITLVTVALTTFFTLFGFLSISEATAQGWTRLDDVNVLFEVESSRRSLQITEPLLRVSVFLGAFSGMYFTVVLATDDTYRDEFSADAARDMRRVLAARILYHHAQPASVVASDRVDGR